MFVDYLQTMKSKKGFVGIFASFPVGEATDSKSRFCMVALLLAAALALPFFPAQK
jgi:hypothetical protein